jgi:hypothetical protein
MDSNTPISQSHALSTAVGHSRLIDLVADRSPLEPGPTYCSGGILGPLANGTGHTSRIDLVLVNRAANSFIEDVTLRWDLAVSEALDHTPIDVILKQDMTSYTIDALMPVEPILLTSLAEVPEDMGSRIFEEISNHPSREGALEKAISAKSVDEAHLEWSRLATDYLLVLE